MNYLSGKEIERIVVPVRCDSERGTAFFINNNQLLTARHVVADHFLSSEAPSEIYIKVYDKDILCKAEELTNPNTIDVALLTIEQEEIYQCDAPLTLLSDEYVKNMPLHVYGYPIEVAMGCNLVDMQVHNGLQRTDDVWGDRAIVRDDKLTIRNYSGLSGSPVVTQTGRVVGVIVYQTSAILNYLSIAKINDILTQDGIPFDTDWMEDDITTFGAGRSLKLCEDAVATMRGRYNPDLHQPNVGLENILDYFCNKKQLIESFTKAKALADYIELLPNQMIGMIASDIKEKPQDITSRNLMKNGGEWLKKVHAYSRAFPFQHIAYWDEVQKLNELAYEIKQEDFSRLTYNAKKNLCLRGKAGSGKTHSLCQLAKHNHSKTNIYLFFGTNFVENQSAIEYIRKVVCEEKDFADLNTAMQDKNRFAVIIIDAINEGLGSNYWSNHLAALRSKLDAYDSIKLIISVRTPFDNGIYDLQPDSWHVQTIEGFEDKDAAIALYFKTYSIPSQYKIRNLDAFQNPLFLKIFCETFHSLNQEEKDKIIKPILYRRYVKKKNGEVSRIVDEDLEWNIADRYLSQLAHYSIFYGHCMPISRSKARQYSKRMAPYRTWTKDLLYACLSSNLLLEDHSRDESAVMFEYENMGDYYKAVELMRSKMDIRGLLKWLAEEKAFIERNHLSSEKFENAVKALFDCWYQFEEDVYNERELQSGGALYELYYDFLMESEDIKHEKIMEILSRLDSDMINPMRLIRKFNEVTLSEAEQIHKKLKKYPSVASRDLIWTRYVNQMYEFYGDDFIGEVPVEKNPALTIDDNERKYLIGITWMLSSSHPKFRAIIIRKLTTILKIHTSLILWLINMFKEVNDPYVQSGMCCAICGVVLPSRDKELVEGIATKIYESYYEHSETVPQDLIVRQWTLKIIERAYYLDNNCSYWKDIKTPFAWQTNEEIAIQEIGHIDKYYFGTEQGSIAIYNSLFRFEDFNRYIIGSNNGNASNDYFVKTEDGKYVGIPHSLIRKEMSYYIKQVFKWNDKLGYLDNGKYSIGRYENEQERIGKKFQWLAWYRLHAHLMDSFYTSKDQFHYDSKAVEADIEHHPYPWNSADSSRFDPTLNAKQKCTYITGFTGVDKLTIDEKDEEDWIENDSYLPIFRNILCYDGDEYVMLVGYDQAADNDSEKETFVISNAGFVKLEEADQFADWAKKQNFYGRWMPERTGVVEYLWSDYPWSEACKPYLEHDDSYKLRNCKCNMLLSYEAQLQEDWMGIDGENEFLSTVYMPCAEIMEQMQLYCSEVRGIIKAEDGSIAAINTDKDNGIDGLFIRRDILNEYIKRNGYVMFYYVLGGKTTKKDGLYYSRDLSAAYKYNPQGEVYIIQPLRVVDRAIPTHEDNEEEKIARRAELLMKKNEEGLTTREMLELIKLGLIDNES
jgi:hypothetical protein